jgi:hypothetical protein
LRGARKADNGILHCGLVEVGTANDIEIDVFERGSHVIRIVWRVRQVGRIRIAAVADDERNAFLGRCMHVRDATKNQSKSKTAPPAHMPRPPMSPNL